MILVLKIYRNCMLIWLWEEMMKKFKICCWIIIIILFRWGVPPLAAVRCWGEVVLKNKKGQKKNSRILKFQKAKTSISVIRLWIGLYAIFPTLQVAFFIISNGLSPCLECYLYGVACWKKKVRTLLNLIILFILIIYVQFYF